MPKKKIKVYSYQETCYKCAVFGAEISFDEENPEQVVWRCGEELLRDSSRLLMYDIDFNKTSVIAVKAFLE